MSRPQFYLQMRCTLNEGYLSFLIEYVKRTAPHLKIIATAGSAEKLELCKKVGADVVLNYKEVDLEKALKEHGPIDMFVTLLARLSGYD